MLNPSSFVRVVQLPVFLFLYLSLSMAQAQVYYSSTAAALGGSGRAAVEAGDAVFLNPATLVYMRDRGFFSSFAKNEMAFSLTDNSEGTAFPGGLSYLQTKNDDLPSKIKNSDMLVTIANRLGERWALGVTAHYFQSDVGVAHYGQTNADFGLTFTPLPNWGLAAVAYNVFGARSDVPESVRLRPKFGVGTNYLYQQILRLRLDVVTGQDSDFGHSTVMGGLESILWGHWLLWRLGGQYDGLLQRTLSTVGLSFEGPKFSLVYAYQGNTKDSSDYRHSVDLVIPF